MDKQEVKIMGKKRGMTQLFDENGRVVVCTVIEVAPNVVTQVKSEDTDGYSAVQLGYEQVRAKTATRRRMTKPLEGHFAKNEIEPRRFLREFRVKDSGSYKVGEEITVDALEGVEMVDVMGTSKGKGFQGVMKLHGFAGGPASHGSHFHRSAGSTGMRSTPGRCLPGGKRASRMGGRRVTTQSLSVFRLDKENGLLLVEGAVPGPVGGLVTVSSAVKKQACK